MAESELSTLLIPYASSPEGKVVIDTFRATVTSLFPHYLDELRGIAVGADVSYENVRDVTNASIYARSNTFQVFLLSLQDEIELLNGESTPANQTPAPASCSDIHVANSEHKVFGHNEDNDSFEAFAMLLVTAKYSAGSGLVGFTALTYPATMAGNAFAVNDNGIALSSNALFPRYIDIHGVPRQYLNRWVLCARWMLRSIADVASVPGTPTTPIQSRTRSRGSWPTPVRRGFHTTSAPWRRATS